MYDAEEIDLFEIWRPVRCEDCHRYWNIQHIFNNESHSFLLQPPKPEQSLQLGMIVHIYDKHDNDEHAKNPLWLAPAFSEDAMPEACRCRASISRPSNQRILKRANLFLLWDSNSGDLCMRQTI